MTVAELAALYPHWRRDLERATAGPSPRHQRYREQHREEILARLRARRALMTEEQKAERRRKRRERGWA